MTDTRKIIRIVPTNPAFPVLWNTGNRCNYDCMYCSPEWHDKVSKHDSLVDFQRYWETIVKKTDRPGIKYKLAFTGGEVTTNKNFKPFVAWLKNNYKDKLDSMILSTNGSASLKYYTELYKYIDNITFSVHSEHIDEKKFFNTIITLSKTLPKDKFIHVGIMDEYWNQERIKYYKVLLEENNISYTINRINYNVQHRKEIIFKGKLNLDIPKPQIL